MRTKVLVVIIFGFLKVATVRAQQDPLYSQYIINPFVINPAYAGLTNNFNASVSYRHQWSDLEGAPKTINANAHLSLFDNRMGAGLMVISDKIGINTVDEVYATYSYRIEAGKDKTLSFGLQAGMSTYKVDDSKVAIYDVTDPLFQNSGNERKPGFGAGIILTGDKFFAGISVPRMLKPSLLKDGVQTTLHDQHFYAMGSYMLVISERVSVKPSALIKMVSGAPASVDVNASFIFMEKYHAGILTRNLSTYGLFVYALLRDNLRFGYVFEVPTGSSVESNFTTHEMTLGFRMKMLGFHSNSSMPGF